MLTFQNVNCAIVWALRGTLSELETFFFKTTILINTHYYKIFTSDNTVASTQHDALPTAWNCINDFPDKISNPVLKEPFDGVWVLKTKHFKVYAEDLSKSENTVERNLGIVILQKFWSFGFKRRKFYYLV